MRRLLVPFVVAGSALPWLAGCGNGCSSTPDSARGAGTVVIEAGGALPPVGPAAPGDAVSARADSGDTHARAAAIKKVFVVAMENHDASEIYGDTADAPYVHRALMGEYAHATRFSDELPQNIPSEPHYVWMEAGQSAFSDHTFTGDADPSAYNSTGSTLHLVTQIANSGGRVTWRSYQEGLDFSTGACPVTSSGFYVAKHDPFVFFQDVAGQPPSPGNANCASHHRPYSAFARDLAVGDVASYTFITPNVCHDMHGGPGCANPNLVQAADEWLSTELPRIIAYVGENAGVLFLVWDEGDTTPRMPFFAIGPGVKRGYAGSALYNHGTIVKSVEEVLRLPVLSAVSGDNDLSDLFVGGLRSTDVIVRGAPPVP